VGATVKILGTNLTGATSVNFNGKATTFTVVSSSEITTTVPAGATTGEVRVVTPSGTLLSNLSFRVPKPSEMNGNAETGGGSVRLSRPALGILAIIVCLGLNNLYAQPQAFDVNKSSLKIRVFKSGAFSAFAHDHEVQAPIEDGKIDSSVSPSVQLRVDSRKIRVLDPEISVDKRAEIQHTMEGNAVLDVEHFPEISYRSTAITKTGDAHWEVRGNLNLHGNNQLVVVLVSLEGGHYRGSASFKQSNFGIHPIRIAGGAVKVKDEVKIEFDIVPVQ
jgi:polyisoprenoid-binding protein YceI